MKRLTVLIFVALLYFTGYSSAQQSVGSTVNRKIEEVISGYLTELNGKYKGSSRFCVGDFGPF